MKKTLALFLALFLAMAFVGCTKNGGKADTSLKDGEIMLSGYVSETYGSSLLLQQTDGYDWQDYAGDRVFVNIGEKTDFVVDGRYVAAVASNSLEGKYISVICSEYILSTYPAQLQSERMIILLS